MSSQIQITGETKVKSLTGVLVGTIINSRPTEDALLGVAINGVVATVTGNSSLKQNSPITFEGDSANAKAVVPALNLKAGTHVQVTMFFARAGELTVSTLVYSQSEKYEAVTA